MAQLTAISGRKIPNWAYRAGAKRSTTISTICTIEAMMAMKRMKLRKLRSTEAKLSLIHVSAPSLNT